MPVTRTVPAEGRRRDTPSSGGGSSVPVVVPSKALSVQIQKQREMKCDYVLFRMVKSPDDPSKILPQMWPLKLSHHAFLQLSFNALKERCVRLREAKDVVSLHAFLVRYVGAMLSYQQRPHREVNDGQRRQSLPPPRVAVDEEWNKDLRIQMRAEYGVDVAVEGPRLAAEGIVPDQLSEDEFYAQLGRPSGLAQECVIS